MPETVVTGPCINASLNNDGTVLVECPHGGRTSMIVTEILGEVLRIRGMCEGCLHDTEIQGAQEEADKRQFRLDEIAPPRMRRWDLESWAKDGAPAVREAALAWLADWRDGSHLNLILHGGVGAGKTGLAWSLLRIVVEHDGLLDVDFRNFRDYLEEIKRTFESKSGNKERDDRPMRRRLLVLDDLGAERPTEWALNELASLVEHRYGNRLPTIVTTNYSPTELVDRLGREERVVGERIVSRLTQDAVQIRFTGRDRRA